MRIIIDATWIATMYGTKVMHGGYRVLYQYILNLENQVNVEIVLTCTTLNPVDKINLMNFIFNHHLRKCKVSCKTLLLFKNKVFKKIYVFLNGHLPLNSFFSFISNEELNRADIYHSPVESIPRKIEKSKIKKYFTALDLIPIINPGYSNQFYSYTKSMYDRLNVNTRVLAISNNTKRDLLCYRPDMDPDKVFVTYLAADKFVFNPEVDEKNRPLILRKYDLIQNKYFLTLNSLAKYKNLEFTLAGFEKFKEDNQIDDLVFVVIGQVREEVYSKELRLKFSSNHIKFLGYVPDDELKYLYNSSVGFVYLSLYEGFGLPVLEAMQCNTPVIASNTTSIPEVAGEAAILIDPTDMSAYTKALYDLMHFPSLAAELKYKGLFQASKFSWNKYVQDILLAFKS